MSGPDTPGRRPPLPSRFASPELDRAFRELRSGQQAAAAQPAAGLRVIAGVTLADGVATPIAHGLGRPPVFVWESCPRDATATGRIVESRSTGHDRALYVVLTATGWGATITIDLAVL